MNPKQNEQRQQERDVCRDVKEPAERGCHLKPAGHPSIETARERCQYVQPQGLRDLTMDPKQSKSTGANRAEARSRQGRAGPLQVAHHNVSPVAPTQVD